MSVLIRVSISVLSVFICLNVCSVSFADDVARPVKMSRAQIEGRIFDEIETIVSRHDSELGEYTTYDAEAFLSSDKKFDMGVYRSGPVRETINEPYGVNEYMHVIAGQIRLISSDGTAIEINPGDAVSVPAEWTGVFESDGYLKIYVIYSPEGPIQ